MSNPCQSDCPSTDWRGTPSYTTGSIDPATCPTDVTAPPIEPSSSPGTVTYGCGLTYADPTVSVNVDQLAGNGLAASGSPCKALNVGAGCGISVSADAVAVDLSAVVADCLYWHNDTCALGLDFGCGLTLVGTELQVDFDQIVGAAANTALKKFGAGPCFNAQVDRTVASTTTETLVNRVSAEIHGAYLFLNVTQTVYTNHFSAAGLHVNRTAGTPSTYGFQLSLCTPYGCCGSETQLDMNVSAYLYGGTPLRSFVVTSGDTVYFDASGITGGTPPYTYKWYFDDPNVGDYPLTPDATGATTSHSFTNSGYHTVLLVVTDSTGCAYERYIWPVFVDTAPGCSCSANCPTGAPLYIQVTLSGGTGDYAAYNGVWDIPAQTVVLDPTHPDQLTCYYDLGVLDKGLASESRGFVIVVNFADYSVTLTRDSASSGDHLQYLGTGSSNCCSIDAITGAADTADAGMTGTPPNLDSLTGFPDGACTACGPTCDSYATHSFDYVVSMATGDCVGNDSFPCASTLSGTAAYTGTPYQWGPVTFNCALGQCEENASEYLTCADGVLYYKSLTGTITSTSPLTIYFDVPSPFGGGGYRITFTEI